MEGVETEISGAITPKWQIHAGYSYLHSQIKTAANPRDDGIFLLVPKHSANLWTTYQVTSGLTVGGGVNAMSGITSSAGMHAGGYATFDAMAAYRFTPKLKLLPTDTFQPAILPQAFETEIKSTCTGRIYRIQTATLGEMQSEGYPVLFVLDGEAFFPRCTTSCSR